MLCQQRSAYSQNYGFSCSLVQMWELDHKEGWAQKNRCFWTVVLEKTLESPLDCKEIKPVNPKGNQSWIFTGRINAKAEAPILWPPNMKSQLIRKDPDAEKDWRQEEKGITEDEMVGWHHRLNGHDLGQTPGDSGGQGSLACCSPWGRKESDTTKQLNINNKAETLLPQASGGAKKETSYSFQRIWEENHTAITEVEPLHEQHTGNALLNMSRE